MLKGLDNANWDRLSGAPAGEHTDVPRLIRSLTATDPQTRSAALDELEDIIAHQGTVCEITSYVIPFLVELLSSDMVLDRGDILLVFYTICWVYREYNPDHRDEPYRTYVQKSLSAIRDGTETYVTLLNSPDYQVRAITAFALPLLTKRDPRSMAAALSRLRVETASEVTASLAWSLGDYADDKSPLLVQDRDQTWTSLRNLVDRGQVPEVRFSAARSLIEVEGSDVGSGVVDILLSAIGL